jgi:hypothetical protein
MRMLNVMVNPSRKYVVTTKFSVDKWNPLKNFLRK